jgi:hypothetical protein
MTYVSDFFLFYAYSLAVSFAILVSAVAIAADAVIGRLRQRKHDGHAFMATKP